MQHKFVIKGRLPGLNEYLKAERSFRRKHSCGNDMKRENQMIISSAIKTQLKRLKVKKPVYIQYKFFERDKRRDLDNISSVAHKFIQDALVNCGTLENDGWQQIKGFTDEFYIDRKNPRIEVTLLEVGD